ncbi:MAG: hypothetical protein V1846_05280 [Candidatus Komeilibacteria bacterium]
MFEPFAKKPEAPKPETTIPEVITFDIPEDALHVMPTQYHGSQPAIRKQKAAASAGPGNPNKRFLLLIGGLALILGAIVAGFYFYAQYFPTTPAPAPTNTNTNVPVTNTPPATLDTTPDITTAEGRDAQRIKDITLLQQALSSYQLEFKVYPQVLAALPAKYLLQEPRDPLSGQSYVYTVITGGSDYFLQFVIESQTIFNGQVITAGVHAVGSVGLLPDGQPPATATSTAPVISNQPDTDSLDTDADGLTAAEEVNFQTDPQNPDTDGDGYKDGAEVLSLYNPLAGKGAFLNVSGLVKIYRNTTYNFSFWVPANDWITRSVDASDQEIILTAPTGDTITVSSQPNEGKKLIDAWYLAQHPEVTNSQLRKLQVGSLSAIESADGLAVYASNSDTIFSITYQPAGSAVDYPAVFQLLLNTWQSPAAAS